jgi:trk system potassium uptake protein TrkA
MKVLIVGALRLGRVLAGELLQGGHEVRILDERFDRLAILPAALEGRTVQGSPLELDTLAGALAGCDALATTTDDDAANAVVALAARRDLRLPLAVAVVRNPSRAEALAGLGVHVVCPTARTVRDIRSVLVRSGVESELALGADAAIFRVEVPARLADRTVEELERPGELVPVAVERDGRVLLAAPGLAVAAGDIVHVAARRGDDLADLVRP